MLVQNGSLEPIEHVFPPLPVGLGAAVPPFEGELDPWLWLGEFEPGFPPFGALQIGSVEPAVQELGEPPLFDGLIVGLGPAVP